jgi:NAD-dependent dihydropyrimidine dehydrogenase PreA subunit
MEDKVYVIPNPTAAFEAIKFNSELCIGCNQCVEVCRVDVLFPNAEKGKPPVVVYPDECWFCGCCVLHCSTQAIELEQPLVNRVGWKRKATGEHFRIGMKNPPAPNTRPPIG